MVLKPLTKINKREGGRNVNNLLIKFINSVKSVIASPRPMLKRSSSLGPPEMSSLLSSSPPSDPDLSVTEEVIIDQALKEKQKIVKEKLEQGERLVHTMTTRILEIEK
jgi:hypothetical protein